jgi:hypothetical protein
MTTVATRIAVAGALALAFALAGCSPATQDGSTPPATQLHDVSQQNEALDAFVATERKSLPTIEQQNPGMFSDVTVESVYPDTVEYRYVYAEQLDPVALGEYFDKMVPTLQEACDTQAFPAMKSAGLVASQKVTYGYYNADGSLIWSHTFTSS